jgi:hypothetical protein
MEPRTDSDQGRTFTGTNRNPASNPASMIRFVIVVGQQLRYGNALPSCIGLGNPDRPEIIRRLIGIGLKCRNERS